MNDTPICPICGKETDTLYENAKTNEIVGCVNCVDYIDAYEWRDEELENQRRLAEEDKAEKRREANGR